MNRSFRRAQLILSLAAICVCIGFLLGEIFDPKEKNGPPSLVAEALSYIQKNSIQDVSESHLLQGAADSVYRRLEQLEASDKDLQKWMTPHGSAVESPRVLALQLKRLARDARFGLSEQEWSYVAIQGLTDSLGDKYCRALDPESYFQLQESLKRHSYVGVGLNLDLRNGKLLVVDVLPNSPAQLAKLRNGDIILKLDGLAVDGRSVREVEEYLRGEEGSSVELLLSRRGKTWKLNLLRESVRSRSVSSEIVKLDGGGNVCWIFLESLTEDSSSELVEVLKGLSPEPPLGCVLDLRGNRGGYLKAAMEVASLFLPSGKTVVLTQERHGTETRQSASTMTSELPLLILVDEKTASSAEILTGALQDHQRAEVLGAQTYGKGSVQTLHELADGGAIKITTALYETPLGRRFDQQGLVPDTVFTDHHRDRELTLEACRVRWKAGK